jgi:adenine specific DNA methylase Mod
MPRKPITANTLFYGDNLPILREHIADESIDLIYLDPPFNSSRTYNVLFNYEYSYAAFCYSLNASEAYCGKSSGQRQAAANSVGRSI